MRVHIRSDLAKFLALAVIVQASGCCGSSDGFNYDTETLVVETQSIGGADIALTLTLHGSHYGERWSLWIYNPAGDSWWYEVRLDASQRGKIVPMLELSPVDQTRGDADPKPLRDAVAHGVPTCTGTDGFAYKLPGGNWTAVWSIAHRVFVQQTSIAADGCDALGTLLDDAPTSWLAVSGGASPCLELDDAGRTTDAMRCAATSDRWDAPAWKNPGTVQGPPEPLTQGDHEALASRVRSDPARRKLLIDAILADREPERSSMIRSVVLEHFEESDKVEIFDRVEGACKAAPGTPDGDGCTANALAYAAELLNARSGEPPPPASCERGLALADAVRARGDADANDRAQGLMRFLGACAGK